MNNRKLIWEEEIIDIEDDETDGAKIINDEGKEMTLKMPRSQGTIQTNLGLFLVDNPTNPYNTRKVFCGHTNFDITEDDVRVLVEIDGVEAFRILSRYCFVIAVGFAFEPESVQMEIEDYFGIEDEELELMTFNLLEKNKERIVAATAKLAEEHWNIFLFPNGREYIEQYKTEEEFDERIPFFIALKEMSQGIFLTSAEETDDEEE